MKVIHLARTSWTVLLLAFALGCAHSAPAPPGRVLPLDRGWTIQSSATTAAAGRDISAPEFDAAGWLPTTVPSTVLAALVRVSAQTPPTKPSSPVTVAPPTWSRVLQMPDGRSFVSDGGLAIDVALVKPASLPGTVIPVESTKAIAARMATPHQEEIGLGQLAAGRHGNSFVTPAGVHVPG